MTVLLVNVPDVPIVSTGTYQLASGETTFSAEDLADAVQAASDPTLVAPRLKLGHTDQRFNEAIAAGDLDGEPAFGTVQNLRLSDDGQTVLGDYVDVPEWLADMLQSSYPGRSIEGGFNVTAASGRTYRLVITACALLGVTWPGVTSLDDLREVLEHNGQAPEPIAAEGGEFQGGRAERFVIARLERIGTPGQPRHADREIVAGLDLGTVTRQFLGDLDTGEVPAVPEGQPQADDVGTQYWWWPRSVRVEDDGTLCIIVDDDEGHLIRIPFTVTQGDLIYGQPQLVIEEYVPVTADPDDASRDGQPVAASRAHAVASFPIRAARRPTPNTTEASTMRINGSEVDTTALRQRLGLADDADDTAIYEALGITAETETEAPEPVAASTEIPEGMALVDQATLDTIRENAEQGKQVAARLAREDRDRFITAAITDGKFPPARRQHYEQLWDADETGTRELIAKLSPGLVPVARQETGFGGEIDTTGGDREEHDQFMARHYPNEASRLSSNSTRGRVRVRQEA